VAETFNTQFHLINPERDEKLGQPLGTWKHQGLNLVPINHKSGILIATLTFKLKREATQQLSESEWIWEMPLHLHQKPFIYLLTIISKYMNGLIV
jgi:hypothetical protein